MIDSCRGKADFVALRRGRRFHGGVLWIAFAADASLRRPRLAFALSRSSGTAVERNQLRRRLRAVFTEHASCLAPGYYLIGARRSVSQTTYRSARSELLDLLRSAGALGQASPSAQMSTSVQ